MDTPSMSYLLITGHRVSILFFLSFSWVFNIYNYIYTYYDFCMTKDPMDTMSKILQIYILNWQLFLGPRFKLTIMMGLLHQELKLEWWLKCHYIISILSFITPLNSNLSEMMSLSMSLYLKTIYQIKYMNCEVWIRRKQLHQC